LFYDNAMEKRRACMKNLHGGGEGDNGSQAVNDDEDDSEG
jgi:hypothetical protein